jgi:hypothetical protein
MFDKVSFEVYPWPPRYPDLTMCDFFLWGYIKDKMYVSPLPTNLEELKIKIKDYSMLRHQI